MGNSNNSAPAPIASFLKCQFISEKPALLSGDHYGPLANRKLKETKRSQYGVIGRRDHISQ